MITVFINFGKYLCLQFSKILVNFHRESKMSDEEGSGSEYCDLEDVPYGSPSEDSENDNELIDMDFSEFCMDENERTSST